MRIGRRRPTGHGSSSPLAHEKLDAASADADELDQRGWDAVTQAAAQHYPGARKSHVAYVPGVHFGSALQGCSALEGQDHWFYVTYGLTELWAKETDDPTISGYGYELTMRVRRLPTHDAPPDWPYRALILLAQYVRGGPQELWLGDRIRLADPITGDPSCALTTLAVALDPVVAPIETPNGRVEFWHAFGLTDEDVEAAKRSSTDEVLQGMALSNPLLITDPARR